MHFARWASLTLIVGPMFVACSNQANAPSGASSGASGGSAGGGVTLAGSSGAGTAAGATNVTAGGSLGTAGTPPGGSSGVGGSGVATTGGNDAAGGGAAPVVMCGDATCDSSESCTGCSSDCGACGSLPAFGNTDIHPQKLDVYMSPDVAQGWFSWDRTARSLVKYHELLPDAWIRWDNETGHNTSTPENVEKFVSLAAQANVPMIIAASAVQGYDNYWALNYGQPAGTPEKQVSITIKNIADGPYLAHAYGLLKKYPNVKFVESINEPDGVWFVGDPDNTESWDYYLQRLYAATSNDYDHILGPATAFDGGKIYKFHAARPELKSFSYHTYGGWEALHEQGDKAVYITEYGYKLSNHATELQAQSPALNLQDLWQIERHDKLDGKIARLAYVYLHTMMLGDQYVGDHHGFTGFFLALASYSALGKISRSVYLDDQHADFFASDDSKGHFGALIWNTSESALMSGQTRSIPNVSANANAKLFVLRMAAWGATLGGECMPFEAQDWVTVARDGTTLNLTANAIPSLEAIYVSTQPCNAFVN